MTTWIVWASSKLYKPGKVLTLAKTSREQRRRLVEELLDVILLWALALHQTIKDWEVEKSLSYTRLAENWGEHKMIQCLEIMPDSWKQRIKEKLKWFNAFRWPCTSLIKAEWRSGSLKVHILPCAYISAIFDSLPHFTISYISGNKRKRERLYFYKKKKQIIFL